MPYEPVQTLAVIVSLIVEESDPSVSQRELDNRLVYRLWEGDLDALGALYDRYSSLVYGVALKGLRQVSDAEDLTQEVFLTLLRTRTYNQHRGTLAQYLTVLTRSRAIDRLRARTTRQKYLSKWEQTQLSAELSTPMTHLTQQERRLFVREALTRLKDRQREVLELSYYAGQSHSEIAKELDVPLGTVKSWARRGLLQLREHLRHLLEEDAK